PVDADGKPIYYSVPKSYADAPNDGERWRWNLQEAAELQPHRLGEVEMIFGNFLWNQFGVQTMTYGFFGEGADDKTGTFALATLKDTETIARLATGIKRFKMPDEQNPLVVFKRVADRDKNIQAEQALTNLATDAENRRQYVKAAEIWQRAIKEYGPGQNNYRQDRLNQIVNNWGRFEPLTGMQPNRKGATVDFRFRNGNKVSLEAFAIDVPKLLGDVKTYLTGHNGVIDWNQVQVQNIGHRLVELNQQQYITGKVANWDLDLTPRPDHVDDRITINTPMQTPGAYLVTAKMAGGNLSRVIVWVTDSVLLKKTLDNRSYYFVADAVTGLPTANAKVDFFGWRQVPVVPNQNQWKVLTEQFTMTADKDGQVFVDGSKFKLDQQFGNQYQWLITARKPDAKGKVDARSMTGFAYLGFTNVWIQKQHDPEYEATRVFAITDRPVYRPDQPVQFKFWVRHSKYDMKDTSTFAGQTFTMTLQNPKGEKVLQKQFVADEYGGFAGEYFLPRSAPLGQYNMVLDNNQGWQQGGNTFRVEEYKKPEFEVKVDAPTEPVKLGDKITATVDSRYYFGAPVVNAMVKVKVMRSPHSATWFPKARWDWFYSTGYWWFAPDYAWYPGFSEWGCFRPTPNWWHQPAPQPELVLENTMPVGPDGKVQIEIDTQIAKELHGNQDHEYTVTAEVTDDSRRTIVGTGSVLVARKPFKVYTWLDRGYYRTGDTIVANFQAQTLDRKPVQGAGTLTMYGITYNAKHEPVETVVERWPLSTNVEGTARQQIKAAKPGQYRLSYKVTDTKQNTIEGAQVVLIRGDGANGSSFRFNDIELVSEKKEYQPGEKMKLAINTNRDNSTVLLFLRPTNNIYLAPKVLRLNGKSIEEQIEVVTRDMPNFFVEAVTISDGRIHSELREIVVPPEKRVLDVAVLPNQKEYKPGEDAKVQIKLTDANGEPFVGSTVVTVYDKSVEYISGGSNVPEIKEYFWKWRRHHSPQTEANVQISEGNILHSGERGMNDLGVFGNSVVEEFAAGSKGRAMLRFDMQGVGGAGGFGGGGFAEGAAVPGAAPMAAMAANGVTEQDGVQYRRAANRDNADRMLKSDERQIGGEGGGAPAANLAVPTIRKNFADTAYWNASLTTNAKGIAEVAFKMPEQMAGWKIRVWGMGHGTKVGQGDAEVVTKKDLIVRLQAPRFFIQKDEVVLSANVHNFHKADQQVRVTLEMDGGTLQPMENNLVQVVDMKAGSEKRIDWRVRCVNEGDAIVRMKAQSATDADAMEMKFPCRIHGMLKMESFAGVIRPQGDYAKVEFSVPAERRIEQTRLEVRYSPTLAGAMVDALPYLVDFPYGCTEQTLNRFVPTVITQKILVDMKIDLAEVAKHETNLNSQEIGNDKDRMKQWKRWKRNPVFDVAEVATMTKAGIDTLLQMQLSDGGWGWFSGFGEHSYPHTTATVVHGLQLAKANGVVLPANMLERGTTWLKNYQDEQVRRLQNWPTKTIPYKQYADNIDSLVYMNLVDGGVQNDDMRDFLYRDRNELAVYAKAMFGLALHKNGQADKLAMILENIRQYVVEDNENQTAYLRLPANNPWWYWYGSEIEADAYYLKLLTRTTPRDTKAAGLVKYLLNNRKHSTYWNSTRDTAICIEAMAEYLKASGEDRPQMNVEVWLDGKKYKDVEITTANLFTFDNKLVLTGDSISAGKHLLEIKRRGSGPVYFNAYETNFTLEDFITKAGLEVRVERAYYKLTLDEDAKVKVSGSRGQALDQKVEKYKRTQLANLAELKSGDMVEVELKIDSKNDYEYLIFEDMKPAGFEPLEVRSGYNGNDMGAYVEFRDEKVVFFARTLARGTHSVRYRMRAEIPGRFSALPTRAEAMYTPELKGNSDEIKLQVHD
ncbi:MAG TPA: MG2 domain-containing protein, partial [Gemmataceae bacterium]|nr:MG2 domain-containing protein [Gemmataceae bacterium]